ncbi:MAG: hypothetical protein C0404_08030 [Verrucomicrobia bacterium]|nr:hypothetical protein [Verrucomicrobiota bacterium]
MNTLLKSCIVAILFLTPTQFGFEVAKNVHVSVVDPLIWITLAIWLAIQIRNGRLKSTCPGIVLPALFILAAGISVVHAENRLAWLKEMIQALEYFVAAYLVFAGIDDEKFLRRLVRLWLFIAGAITIAGAIQYFATPVDDMHVSATFGNRNIFGGYLAMMLPMALATMVWTHRWWLRFLMLSMVMLGFVVNLSGGACIAMVIATGCVAMARSRWIFAIHVVVVLLLVAVALPRLPRQNDEKIWQSISIYDGNDDVARRYKEWHAAAAMARENALFGVGAGNYQQNLGRYYGTLQIPSHVAEPDSQNLYLVLASSMGIGGVLSFLGILMFFGLKSCVAAARTGNIQHRSIAVGLAGLLIGFSIGSIWSPLLVRGTGLTLAMAIGLVTALGRLTASSNQPVHGHGQQGSN